MIPRFRVWDKNRKTMAPLLVLRFDPEGVQLDAVHVLPENGNDYFDFADSFVLMLSTGLTDSKGQEIYEGDILGNYTGKWYLVQWDPSADTVVVEYHHGAFHPFADNEDQCPYPEPEECEVIGNIWENPELLKETP